MELRWLHFYSDIKQLLSWSVVAVPLLPVFLITQSASSSRTHVIRCAVTGHYSSVSHQHVASLVAATGNNTSEQRGASRQLFTSVLSSNKLDNVVTRSQLILQNARVCVLLLLFTQPPLNKQSYIDTAPDKSAEIRFRVPDTAAMLCRT